MDAQRAAIAQLFQKVDFGREKPSANTRLVASWIVESNDQRGLPFAIIDKPNARLFVFTAEGKLKGAAPVLLGLARGDGSVPGIGSRPIADIRPAERTTPAGRFVTEPGRNANGEDIVWVDYDNAISMHRVRPNNPAERRLQRLASRTAADNRISYGCINVPTGFYNEVVNPTFGRAKGLVYVLPDIQSMQTVFGLPAELKKQARRSHKIGPDAPA